MDIPDNADWLFALSDLRRTWLTTGDPKLKSWLDGTCPRSTPRKSRRPATKPW